MTVREVKKARNVEQEYIRNKRNELAFCDMDDITRQVYKLVYRHAIFLYKRNIIKTDDIDEYINIVFEFLLKRDIINKYSEHTDIALSTYIYNYLRWEGNIFLKQLYYNLDYTRAKDLTKNEEKFKVLQYTLPFSALEAQLTDSNLDNNNSNYSDFIDYAFKDPTINVEKDIEEKDFVDTVMNYIKETNKIEEKDKKALLYFMTDGDFNLTKTVRDCNLGCTKQAFQYKVRRLGDLLKKERKNALKDRVASLSH